MSRTSTLIVLGVLIALAPFSGIPVNLRALLEVIFGMFVLGIGFSLRAHEARRMHGAKSAPVAAAAELPVEPQPIAEPPHGVSPI
ncbi:MAG TPA: hypothetical protein VMV50_00685 [Candidatus Paceibacterota bacterium]|nr:hypothetical protein [Candidatus Paceibacterota bacterium]